MVYRVEMDQARIDSLVIGASILGSSGAAAFTWHEHARHLVLDGGEKNSLRESVGLPWLLQVKDSAKDEL